MYYGTDTHASALFTGSALALTWPLRLPHALSPDRARVPDPLDVAGIAVLAWATGHLTGTGRVRTRQPSGTGPGAWCGFLALDADALDLGQRGAGGLV